MDPVRSVLVVDDSRLSRMMISKIISTHHSNWLISEAENADQALELCTEQLFDYITLDHNMPGMTGIEAYPQIREIQPDAQIGLFTANVQKSTQEKSESIGLQFIAKPLNEEKVMAFFQE
ncbi:response regulator transcription factor [Neptuniibacter halophilus]|uniref:response regulator transcription factor n=1 Tax=Neptuniibacter halophilus TaxID=651666 RepID=UPI0025747B75|nr:response regulator [Neptuniibacter halophilus]